MALSSTFTGDLVGYKCDEYTDKSTGQLVTRHHYFVFVKQRVDKTTNLPTECAVAEVIEPEQVLGDKLKPNMKVTFWQEETQWRDKNGNNQFAKRYVGIEAV